MLMEVLTLLQLLAIALLYIFVFILAPAAVFHRKFEDRPVFVRFMAYLTIGNFYVMNLVYLLQLFHIANRITLILGYLIPMLLVIAVMNWQEWVKTSLVTAGETTHNVMVNTMGIRLFFTRVFQLSWQAIGNMAKTIAESLVLRWMDWIGTILIIVITWWQYGTNLFTYFGYTASDMLVHNYWINSMNENHIFVAGVYPYGFHCIVYFLHAVFGFETFVILRVFSLIETALIHIMLLCFLRLVCKLETNAYVITAIYLMVNMWSKNSYMRFFSALPQEYGMIFILPAVCFLLLFFRDRWDEGGAKGFRHGSTRMLLLFAMNVSLTLAAHFYDTIALGIFCICIAIGFANRVFRKGFLFRIVGFGMGALLVAILPMWIAYLAGTPMEGSMRWGVSVIKGGQELDAPEATKNMLREYDLQDSGSTQGQSGTGSGAIKTEQGSTTNGGNVQENGNVTTQETKPQKPGKMKLLFQYLRAYLTGYVFEGSVDLFSDMALFLIVISTGIGILCFLKKDAEHGSVMITCALNLMFLCIVMISKELKLPVLMDKNRCSVYFAYFFVAMFGLVLDYVLSILLAYMDEEILLRVIPAGIGVVFFVILAFAGAIRKPAVVEAFQKNGAVICVTNILRDNPKHSFTIISANDELRMIEDYGYHYEVDKLLVNCLGNNASGFLIIPTSKLYVFVEKIPGTYDEPYEGSGKAISWESAKKPLPVEYGIRMYKGERRHIVMSKLYFWAKEFAHLFKNEISVYYEDEEFVCYMISQNVDRPYDMSFAYGYNN